MKKNNLGFTPTPICIMPAKVKSNSTASSDTINLRCRCTNRCEGFTLAELVMAMWVMCIIFAAVAALAFALGYANDSVDDVSEIQSRIRYTTIHLGELVRNSKLICQNWGSKAAIWRADYNNDGQIEPNEIVYIETGSGNNCIQLVSYQPSSLLAGTILMLGDIIGGQAQTWLKANCQENTITLMDNCSYVTFTTDRTGPPWTFSKRLNIFFGISHKGSVENYQISEYLRCYSDYLLNDSGQMVSSDDDM